MGKFKATQELLDAMMEGDVRYFKDGVVYFNQIRIENKIASFIITLRASDGTPLARAECPPWGAEEVFDLTIHEGSMSVLMNGFA